MNGVIWFNNLHFTQSDELMTADLPGSDAYNLPSDIDSSLKKLGLATSLWERKITPEEIQYFIDRWPFIQILSSNQVDTLDAPKVITAKTNWQIISYGDALTTSPGQFLFGGSRASLEDDDDDRGTGDNPGQGTIWAQAYKTTQEMIELAQQLGWEGVHIVDGHPLMCWSAWMAAEDDGLMVTGFKATRRDVERRERVKRSEFEDAKIMSAKPS